MARTGAGCLAGAAVASISTSDGGGQADKSRRRIGAISCHRPRRLERPAHAIHVRPREPRWRAPRVPDADRGQQASSYSPGQNSTSRSSARPDTSATDRPVGRRHVAEDLHRHRHRARQRVQRVAPLEHRPHRDAELQRHPPQRPRHLAVAGVGDPAVGQRVLGMGVEARGHQQELRRVGARQRHHHVVDQRPELGVARARGHRQVDREPAPRARADVRRRPRPRIERRLVDRAEQHAGLGVEDVVGPVAVMHVPVDDHHALQAVGVHRVPRGHGDAVEQAEPHGPRRLGMVPRGPVHREARRRACRTAAGPPATPRPRTRAARPRTSPPRPRCRRRSARRPAPPPARSARCG